MKFFLTFMMVFIGRALAISSEPDIEGYGYTNYYPIEVQMKCSQVNQQVLCGFDFTNNAKEDYYILKRDTPLDGLDSPYLTISQGNDVVQYGGIIALMAAPTKDDFTFIQAGETVSASIDLTSSYKFTRDGIYTVEYTRPLAYLSSQEMSMMSNKDLLQASHYEDLVVSTEVEVMNSHNLEPTLAEIESAEGESTSSEDETVYINARCSPIVYTTYGGAGAFSDGIKCVIKQIHTKLCNPSYGLQKALAVSYRTGSDYVKWFGRNDLNNERRKKVYDILKKIFRGMTKTTPMTYSNGGQHCQANWYAYTFKASQNTQRRLYMCPLFFKNPDFSSDASRKSKFHTISHELSHKLGDTDDERVNNVKQYGYARATALAINHPAQAINNADNYAFFIEDVYDEFYK